jgi:uncharacterized protein (DUF1919 family)
MAKLSRRLPQEIRPRPEVVNLHVKAFLRRFSEDALEASIKWKIVDEYFSFFARLRLKNKSFTIISNNCVGGGIYHKLGIPYSSPTVGLFFFSEDYIRFLEHFEYYIKQPLQFKESSIYKEANELKKIIPYPIATLGDDVEIHFLHYRSQKEAVEKWDRRMKRINRANLFFIYSDGGGAVAGAGLYDFHEDYLNRYEKLPFSNKIFFSSKPRQGKSVVFIRDYQDAMHVDDSTCNRKYEKYINIIKWLNGERNFKKNTILW